MVLIEIQLNIHLKHNQPFVMQFDSMLINSLLIVWFSLNNVIELNIKNLMFSWSNFSNWTLTLNAVIKLINDVLNTLSIYGVSLYILYNDLTSYHYLIFQYNSNSIIILKNIIKFL